MEADSDRSAARKARRYRITVRGELSESFVKPFDYVSFESSGDESILACQVVDQAQLQGVLSRLYVHGVEIVSLVPEGLGADFENPVTES